MSSLHAEWKASPKPRPRLATYKERREAGASHCEAIVTRGWGKYERLKPRGQVMITPNNYVMWINSPCPKPKWLTYKARREMGASHEEAILITGKGRKSPWPNASSHVMVSVPPAIKAWLLANPAEALTLATR